MNIILFLAISNNFCFYFNLTNHDMQDTSDSTGAFLFDFLFRRLNVKTVCVFKKRFVSKLFVNVSVLNRL
jgi:hypothetical protein